MTNTDEITSITSSSDNSNVQKNLTFISERIITSAIAPNDISIKAYDFQLTKYQKHLFYEFSIPLPDSINNAVPKRQAEFLAGRYSAIMALNALGLNCRNISIGKHRSPVWPSSIIASITHTATISICAASYKGSYQYLGIDLENIISIELVNEIKSYIITIDEEEVLRKCPLNFLEAFTLAFTLAFSAKESLFKALYPSVGYYFDFSIANIIQLNNENNSFTLVLTEDLTDELIAGMEFIGFFNQIEQQVLTVIAQ